MRKDSKDELLAGPSATTHTNEWNGLQAVGGYLLSAHDRALGVEVELLCRRLRLRVRLELGALRTVSTEPTMDAASARCTSSAEILRLP